MYQNEVIHEYVTKTVICDEFKLKKRWCFALYKQRDSFCTLYYDYKV